MIHKFIYQAHPEVARIDGETAYDSNGNVVEYDQNDVIQKSNLVYLRAKRNRLLTDSDWVTIRATDTGNPVPIEWQTYRQALRDITEQPGFPENIDWPTKPEDNL